MSLLTSLYSGTSGLQANSLELSVIGDNIANANTIGFKSGRAAFEDALQQSLIGGSGGMGLGTRLQTIQRIITQGALTSTGLATDLALHGPGTFVVRGQHAGQEGTFYTRAGQFTLNSDGFLVTLEGLRVQGFSASPTGAVGGTLGDLRMGDAAALARATGEVTFKGNLQADATVMPAWSAADPSGTSNFSSTATVYDSLGKAHTVDVYFRRTGTGTWEWHALTDGAGVQGGAAGTPQEVASGALTFDAEGRLTTHTQSSSFNPVGAVQPQPLSFNFGDPTDAGGTGLGGLSGFAGTSALSFSSQNGYASGSLANIRFEADGTVIGVFTNGQSRALGQVAVADFAAPDKLERIGGNLLARTPGAGDPNVGAAGSGGRAGIVAGALEQSNVDLATEFVRMIAAQRGFQANSKTITTADQLLAELMTLKR